MSKTRAYKISIKDFVKQIFKSKFLLLFPTQKSNLLMNTLATS